MRLLLPIAKRDHHCPRIISSQGLPNMCSAILPCFVAMLACVSRYSHTHTHTHTHAHTHAHPHNHNHTHTHDSWQFMFTPIPILMLSPKPTLAFTHTDTCAYTYDYALFMGGARFHACRRQHAQTYTRTHTNTSCQGGATQPIQVES